MNKKLQTIKRVYALAELLNLEADDILFLTKIERTLQRWAERESGNSTDSMAYWVEVDDDGKAWEVRDIWGINKQFRYRIPNMEASALRKLSAFCKDKGLYAYHQSDPRGCQLYISREHELTHENYTGGIAVFL